MIRPLDDEPPRAGHRPDASPPAETDDKNTCPLCGGAMFGAHCKLICNNCGYREDCSDLFPEQ